MQLKTLAAAAVLAAVSFGASATNQNFGNITGTTVNVGDFFPTGSSFFSDIYTFTTTGGSITGAASSFGITDFAVILLSSSPLSTIGIDSTPVSFSFSGLSAGTTYALQFVGVASAGGVYGGTVTAVPEPETYALMLAGLGAMGFIAMRRQRG